MKHLLPRLTYPLSAGLGALALLLWFLLINPSPSTGVIDEQKNMDASALAGADTAHYRGNASWHSVAEHAHAFPAGKTLASKSTVNEPSKRDYVLEIIGLGVTLDKYRQGKLWEALQKGHAYASIREQDKEKYPWSGMEKAGISGGVRVTRWRMVH